MPRPWYDPFYQALHVGAAVIGHAAVVGLLLVGDFGLHYILVQMGDPKFYDLVPWRYVVNTMGLALALGYIVYGTISFVDAVKEGHRDE